MELIKSFYKKLYSEWKNIDTYKIEGQKFINNIKKDYNCDSLTIEFYDLFMEELLIFGNSVGQKFKALIMKGGGIKGLAYVGALEELDNFHKFNWYAGTSAGAIAAILLGSGHTLPELNNILKNKNFNDFRDSNFWKAVFYNFFVKGALYEANSFTSWMEQILADKFDSSTSVEMGDMPIRTTVYASRRDISAQIFDSKNEQSKFTKVAFAARCSMSIPWIFTSQKIDGRNVIDGGVKNNFPVEILLKDNPDTEFIGLYLGNPIYKHEKVSRLKELVLTWMESNDYETLKKYKEKIIIIDPSPINTLKFKLNSQEKDFLIEAGRLATIKFLDKNKTIIKEGYNYSDRIAEHENIRKELKYKKVQKKIIKVSAILIVTLIILSIKYIVV